MHDKALEAARNAAKAALTKGGEGWYRPMNDAGADWISDEVARAAILAFLEAVHQDTDPEETARYCMLAQLRREIAGGDREVPILSPLRADNRG